MGRTLSVIATFFFSLTICQGNGDLSPEIREGNLWKKHATKISFLQMEPYQVLKNKQVYVFSSPRATLAHCSLQSITLVMDETSNQPTSLYIDVYDSDKTTTPISLESFRATLDLIKNTLDKDLGTTGKLGADKASYTWDTMNGGAHLSFATHKSGSKVIPHTLQLILTKKSNLSVALRDREKLTSGDFSNKKTIVLPKAKRTRDQLKEQVTKSAGNAYIDGIPLPNIRNVHQLADVHMAVSILKYYGTPDVFPEVYTRVMTAQIEKNKTNINSPLSAPEMLDLMLKEEFKHSLNTLENLVEGKDTLQLIKKCDREAKTPYERNAWDRSYRTLFGFEKDILIKIRASNASVVRIWLKSIMDNINAGQPILWWHYDNQRPVCDIIIGYNDTRQEIIYMTFDKDFLTMPVNEAMAYSIKQTVITP